MFSIERDDPFLVFRHLKEIARKHHADADIIDLSRGDPGFCFTPSIKGRELSSFILWLDSTINVRADETFLQWNPERLWAHIEDVTAKTYTPETATKLLGFLRTFIEHAVNAAREEGQTWNDEDVLRELFAYGAMAGGSYLVPEGQLLSRIIVAAFHRSELGINVTSADVILTSGVSHGIGTVFKALGSEGCGFLKQGDTVCISSPVYAPYNRILQERGIKTVTYTIDPITGALDLSALEHAEAKALILIDPNNPTGFSVSEESLEKLAALAKEKDLLIITDEVYSSFFPPKKTILSMCPERTIYFNARSKIERATGLRFGEIVVLSEGRDAVAAQLGLTDGDAFKKHLIFSKAPGRTGGQFQHTTFVPGPSQLLGICHLVLGTEEREQYKHGLMKNREIFYAELGLPHQGNLYYVLFDLDAIEGCATQELSMEERLTKLAEAGVIYLPAYQFFAQEQRNQPGVRTTVRASIVNTVPEKLREAAKRTKDTLCKTAAHV